MDTSDIAVKNKWKENRLSIWRGSFRHFVNSVITDTYQKDGFNIYNTVSSKDDDNSQVAITDKNFIGNFLLLLRIASYIQFNFPQKLIVKYQYDSKSPRKTSTIENREKSKPMVDYYGNLFDTGP